MNFLLLTYDSCRYDVLAAASTPVLDSYSAIFAAESPANFTFASHQAFFVGILPYTVQDVPYYNRFCKHWDAISTSKDPEAATARFACLMKLNDASRGDC